MIIRTVLTHSQIIYKRREEDPFPLFPHRRIKKNTPTPTVNASPIILNKRFSTVTRLNEKSIKLIIVPTALTASTLVLA
jgi:hypothetical protein